MKTVPYATLLLADYIAYNTLVPLAGTLLLGMCGGTVGTFMLLRKKALVGDVASHAALPGICIAYLITEAISPGNGKSLPWLLVGCFAFVVIVTPCSALLCAV